MTDKNIEIIEYAISQAQKNGARKADAIIFNSNDISISQRLGKLENIEQAGSQGLGLRVFVEGKNDYSSAIISTSDIGKNAVDELSHKAIAMAKSSPVDEYIDIASEDLFAKNNIELDLYDDTQIDVEDLKNWAAEAEDAALSVVGVNNSEGADASFSTHKVAFATSNGFCQAYESTTVSISASMIAGEGQNKETDYDYSVAHHVSDLKSAREIGLSAGQRTVKRLNPRKVKTCQVPVVFESRVARSLLGAFSKAINGESVAKGTSFLSDKIGQKIFADNIIIHDNPLLPRRLGSEPFDAEGVAGQDIKIIDNGVLTSWLLDIRSSNKLGLKTTGNASRGICSSPHPSPSNFYMEAGKLNVSGLISDIKSGLYVTDIFGMGINGVTGDYSQGAAGFWIENGVISYPVSEITIASNLLEMFKNLTPASDLEFTSSINCPTMRIESMMVAGI